MSILNYKGYTGSVEFSQEDNCLYGKFLRMPSDLHSKVATTAAGLGMTINGFINTAILDELSKYQ